MEHIKELRRNFEVALNHFNYADKEHIDVAIENLNIALKEFRRIFEPSPANKECQYFPPVVFLPALSLLRGCGY